MKHPTRFLVLSLFLAGLARGAEERPNILFLFSDDQRADTIACLGNEHIRTPTLDRLAQSGTVFTRAYCMGSWHGAVCAPSRAMLMTGRTLYRVKENLAGATTWPEMFARDGYSTFITGKWHNGRQSVLRAFQQGKAVFLGGMGNPYALPIQDFSSDHTMVNQRKSGEHSVKLFADAAIGFLKQQKAGKPFLCYVAFNCPHDPRLAPKPYRDRYNGHEPPPPANFLPQHPFNNGEMVIRDELLAPWPRTPQIVRQHLADYYSYIEFLDDQVARIIAALEATGLKDNTIIVFTSDHGLAIGSHGLFGKQNLYDHSMHSPLIMSGPGIPRGKQTAALCYLLDLFPTLGEFAHVPAPEGSEGRSLAPVLRGQAETRRNILFTAYARVQRALRDDRWKLIRYAHINKTQLFDLRNDPIEMHDLAAAPAYADQVRRLTSLLRDEQAQAGDTQTLTTDHPQPLDFDFTKVKRQGNNPR
ncbi:MAG: sulfatase-like hydrolase/transferase [Isosphaeraceae bacterium]